MPDYGLGIWRIVYRQSRTDGFDHEAASDLADIAVTEYQQTGFYSCPTFQIRTA